MQRIEVGAGERWGVEEGLLGLVVGEDSFPAGVPAQSVARERPQHVLVCPCRLEKMLLGG